MDVSVGAVDLEATGGDVTIGGYSMVTLNGTAVTAGSIAGTTLELLRAFTNGNEDGQSANAQTVTVAVGDNAIITAARNIKLSAENYGNSEGKVSGGGISGSSMIDVKFAS